MKTAIVPAQITTVEDRIAGNLSMSQLLLLGVPLFGGSAAYIALPPVNGLALYKLFIIFGLLAIFGSLAIRVKGKLLLNWAITVLRYNVRPRYFVYNKNNSHMRKRSEQKSAIEIELPVQGVVTPDRTILKKVLSTPDMVRLEELIANPGNHLQFKPNKKGGLSVSVTKVQSQG